MERKLVGRNELGLRVGQDHHRSVLTDHEVELVREMHDEGLGYKRLAVAFEVSPSLIRKIVKCQVRAQTPTKWTTLIASPIARQSDLV